MLQQTLLLFLAMTQSYLTLCLLHSFKAYNLNVQFDRKQHRQANEEKVYMLINTLWRKKKQSRKSACILGSLLIYIGQSPCLTTGCPQEETFFMAF
jgi:hypothetical protein